MKDKKYEIKEVAEIIAKSMSKAVKKANKFKAPIEDVLDANFKPEANPKDILPAKSGIMYKKDVSKASCLEPEHLDDKMNDLMKPSKNSKLKKFLDKKKSKK
jgi:hypothetical protein